MISIIICSRKKDPPEILRRNISDTVGVEFELVTIDNSNNGYSLFSAYNEGVRRSKGDILCFCHDDILFHSGNWGSTIQELFSDESVGALGVIGTHFLPNAPMYWWSSPFISQYSINNDNGEVSLNDNRDYFHEHLADVVAIDGVCFFIPKRLFSSIRFDDKTYDGFHVYDMDISMQVQKLGKRVCVTDVLTIEHFWSEASLKDKKYMAILDNNLNLFQKKWEKDLPMVRGIDEPETVIHRVNNLCIQAYEATRVRRSKAYRFGRLLIKPLKAFKKKVSLALNHDS